MGTTAKRSGSMGREDPILGWKARRGSHRFCQMPCWEITRFERMLKMWLIDQLARTPELHLLAHVQFAIGADTGGCIGTCSSLPYLTRRSCGHSLWFSSADSSFFPNPRSPTITPRNRGYLSTTTSPCRPSRPSIRKQRAETICNVVKQRMVRGGLRMRCRRRYLR